MTPLTDFLALYPPQTEELVHWDELRLRVTSHICPELPPIELITSVRAVVLHAGAVMVVRAPEGVHILPGGRREPNESLIDTLIREVLEETGWTITPPRLLGFKHFHHFTPMPPAYRYPYPDFLQLIYTARAGRHQPEAQEVDGYELEAGFMPIEDALRLGLAPNDQMWLQEAFGKDQETGEETSRLGGKVSG